MQHKGYSLSSRCVVKVPLAAVRAGGPGPLCGRDRLIESVQAGRSRQAAGSSSGPAPLLENKLSEAFLYP